MDAGDSEGHVHAAWRVGDDLSRLRGEALFVHSRNAVVDIDPDGVIMAFNPAAEHLLGHRARDVVGGPLHVLIPDRSAEDVAGLFAELTGRREVEPFATTYRRPDGAVLELSVTAVPMVRSDGSAAGLSVILQDLTALHRAQAAVAASEARYRTMIESAHEGVAVLDAEHRFTFVNARFAEMFGYDVDEMTGMSLDTLTFPEDADVVAGMMQRRQQGLSEDDENRWRRKDGSTLWTMKAIAPLVDEAGTFTGAVAFHTDVTDRKRAEGALRASEARLRSYFEYVPVGILLVNRHGLVVNVNPALCQITGFEKDELLGADLHDLQGRIEENEVGFGALLRGELPSFRFERPFVTKDGRSIWLDVTASVMRDEHGEPIEFVVVLQDVTSRKDAERVKDEFVSVTSHELRTPLTSIRGALGLLTGGAVGGLPDSAQRMLAVAMQSTDRLIRLINDILDLERLSSGKLSLSLEACDAEDLVVRAIEEIRGAADALGVEVRATSVDGRVWADPDRIIQALTNLIGNAIKFSPPSATVEVSARVDGDHVRFAVEDRGPGIPSDQLDTVFERFRQVDASDSRAKGGTGLGLAICRTIVEQHGGRIWVESALGVRTIFTFTLPTAAISDVLSVTLESSGYRVWTATSGEEALAVASARHVDVIVLDRLLPGTCGRVTARAPKGPAETADVPVVVASVLSAEDVAAEGAPTRAPQPIEDDVLVRALRTALGGNPCQTPVEDDDPRLAEVLEAMLARHGLEVRRARTGREVTRPGRARVPDLLVLDLSLLGGDGDGVVEWLRNERWMRIVPVLVSTACDLDDAERDRVRMGETGSLPAGSRPSALFEAELDELLAWWLSREAVPR